MKKSLGVILLTMMLVFSVGCSTQQGATDTSATEDQIIMDTPEKVLDAYLTLTRDGDYRAAYNILTQTDIDNISYSQFSEWQIAVSKVYKLNDYSYELLNEFENKEINGISYEKVQEYEYSITETDLIAKEEIEDKFSKNIVLQNGEWRMALGYDDLSEFTQAFKDYAEEGKIQNAEANVEIIEQTGMSWTNSINTLWAHGAIKIKNTGETPVDLGNIVINFLGNDKLVLRSMSMVMPVPQIIMPGEIAYAGSSTTIDGYKESDIVDLEAFVDFNKTIKESPNLLVSNLTAIDQKYGGVKITGRVKNILDRNADDIRIAIALFDENDSLIGVMHESPMVTLGTEREMGFECSYPEVMVKASEIKRIEAKAYNWEW